MWYFLIFMICGRFILSAGTIESAIRDDPQIKTISYGGVAFITGDLCSQTFLPPGKVADFFGFQYFRDIEPDGLGHNTDFAGKIGNNILFLLNTTQKQMLIDLAQVQETMTTQYQKRRFPLMLAFSLYRDCGSSCQLLEDGIKEYSKELYQYDGEISLARAKVLADVIKSLNSTQRAYLDKLTSFKITQFPEVGKALGKGFEKEIDVLVTTYATQLYSWYAGTSYSDAYFCPERHGTYFGGFYLKDMPAMGKENYTIDETITGRLGELFLNNLNQEQNEIMKNIIDLQRDELNGINDTRFDISILFRELLMDDQQQQDIKLKTKELLGKYGEYDGYMNYLYAKAFGDVKRMLNSTQMNYLEYLRKYSFYFDEYPCSGYYVYSDKVDDGKDVKDVASEFVDISKLIMFENSSLSLNCCLMMFLFIFLFVLL